jgi:TrmH family RNA methyltransferase
VGNVLITSPDNEAVKLLRRLAHRRSPGAALLEGPRVVREAADAGAALELLAVREGDRFKAPAERTIVLEEHLFNTLSQTVTPQGVMAVARVELKPFTEALAAARAARWPLVVLDGIQDPGNVGTICRTAAAAGAPALAVISGTADPFGPKAVRASAGNVFRLVVARAEPKDLKGLRASGAAASGGAPLLSARIEKADILLLGSEAHGLSRKGVELVTIPVADEVESLNVAAAAAVLLFEIRRRRSA